MLKLRYDDPASFLKHFFIIPVWINIVKSNGYSIMLSDKK